METRKDKFLGICGVCGDSIFSMSTSDKPGARYGNKCDRHHLIFCLGCCAASARPVPCTECARDEAKGASDPAFRSVGKYAPRTLESDIGIKISYIHYGGGSQGDNSHTDLIKRIQLMSSYRGVSNPSFKRKIID